MFLDLNCPIEARVTLPSCPVQLAMLDATKLKKTSSHWIIISIINIALSQCPIVQQVLVDQSSAEINRLSHVQEDRVVGGSAVIGWLVTMDAPHTSRLQLIETTPEVARPLTEENLELRCPPSDGLDVEARARRRAGGSLLARKAALVLHTLAGYTVFAFGRRIAGFDPTKYRRELIANDASSCGE